MKLGMKDGQLMPFVQEITLNTYTRFDGFNAGAADAYWAKTKDYWDAAIMRDNGIYVLEEAQVGSASGARLMTYADEIDKGTLTTAQAITQARAVIGEVTTAPVQAEIATKPTASAY